MPRLLKRLNAAALIALCFAIPLSTPAADDPTAAITARIVQARDYTSSFVVLAKQSLTNSPADLQQAQKLYASAYADYNAWVAYVKTALEDGKSKNLGTDADYQKISSDAATAGSQFTNFVDSKTGGSKAVTAILSSLGALGLQLWNGIKDRVQKDRTTAATNFEQDTKWLPWESITTDPVKAAKPAQTNSATPPGRANSSSQPTQASTSTP
jgi:hypothetical protein